jgi:hypothetical protein
MGVGSSMLNFDGSCEDDPDTHRLPCVESTSHNKKQPATPHF